VDLLRETYDSVEDIDLYVGGTLETFTTFDDVLAGATLGCIIGEQYKHAMGGDAYYYSHKTNPYPLTTAQINTINSFSFLNLICLNSDLDLVPKFWFLSENAAVPKVSCSNYRKFDWSAWLGL
jgi:hypothetical protein